MKIIALGDIHGRTIWKGIVNNNLSDKIVFVGDYFDSKYGISPEKQKENFRDIIEYKRLNKNKVILLIGNHDFHYLKSTEKHYSGFQPGHKIEIQELLHEAIDNDFIKMCHIEGNVIFSHAGFTKTWCKNNLGYENPDIGNFENLVNDLFKNKPNAFKFTPGKNNSTIGDDICQTPIWVRPNSLLIDKIDNFIQVVGHTEQISLIKIEDIILIDSLGTTGEYLQITDNSFECVKEN